VGVGVLVGVTVGVVVFVGVVVTLPVGALVGLVVGLGVAATAALVGVADGVGVSEIAGTVVGVINITLIALSSGTGETVFLLETTTPMTTTMNTTIPAMIVRAANVLRRSSIYLVYKDTHARASKQRDYLISSFFQAAKLHVG
jgi:hypothetical protein